MGLLHLIGSWNSASLMILSGEEGAQRPELQLWQHFVTFTVIMNLHFSFFFLIFLMDFGLSDTVTDSIMGYYFSCSFVINKDRYGSAECRFRGADVFSLFVMCSWDQLKKYRAFSFPHVILIRFESSCLLPMGKPSPHLVAIKFGFLFSLLLFF